MNINEAKRILLAYRPGTEDAGDGEVAAALELARQDPELKRWLEASCAGQEVIRDKFRQIKPPTGLKEQILSEHAADRKPLIRPTSGLLAGAVTLLAALLAVLFILRTPANPPLTAYRNRMISKALSLYSMDLISSNAPQVLGYLKQNGAPADDTLPPALAQATLVGCARPKWNNANVAMICFRTGKPLPAGAQSDLWLFVIDHAALTAAPKPGPPVFARVNQLMTATWTRGDKTYLLGVEGDEAYLRTFL